MSRRPVRGDASVPSIDMENVKRSMTFIEKKFHVGDDLRAFRTLLNIATENLSEKEKLIVLKLSLVPDLVCTLEEIVDVPRTLDAALDWLATQVEEDRHPSYNIWRIITETQGPNENVASYGRRVKSLFNAAYKNANPERIMLDLLWLGLQPEMAKELTSFPASATFEEMMTAAVAVDKKARQWLPSELSVGPAHRVNAVGYHVAPANSPTHGTQYEHRPAAPPLRPQPVAHYHENIPPEHFELRTNPEFDTYHKNLRRFEPQMQRHGYGPSRGPDRTPRKQRAGYRNYGRPTTPYSTKPQCFTCGGHGHLARDCSQSQSRPPPKN